MGHYLTDGNKVLHTNAPEGAAVSPSQCELIAEGSSSEKAHFLAIAANAFKEPMVEGELQLDCYLKAEVGEPKFTLLARDPLAPFMVALWGALRKGDTASAVCLFADMVADPAHNYRVNPAMRSSPEKLASAANIANEMVEWRKGKGLEAFEVHTVS